MDAERARALSDRLVAQFERHFDEEWTEADEEAWRRAGRELRDDQRAERAIETWAREYEAGSTSSLIVVQVQGQRPLVSWRARR